MVLHNYVHVLASCDRVNLIQDGVITLDKPTAETSVEELTEIVVEEYRRARAARRRPQGAERACHVTSTSSASTSGRCPGAPWWCGRPTARSWARRCTSTRTAVIERDAAGLGRAPAGRSGRCRIPRTGSTCCAPPCPPPSRPPASRPSAIVGHRDRLHRVDAAAGAARRHAAVPRAGARAAPARLPEAVEAPRRAAPRRPRQRGRRGARRAVAGALRRADLVRVGVRQGAPGARRGPRGLRALRALDRGRGLDRLAALRRRDAQRLHGRLQGDPPGRPLPVGGLPARARRALRATSWRPSWTAPLWPLGARAGGLTAQAAAWTGLREGIAVAVGNVDAHVTAPAARVDRPGPDARGHGHVDLPHRDRRRARRGAGHVRRRRRRRRARPVRLRGRPDRGRRHLRLVRRPRGAAALPRGGARPRARPARAPVRARRRARRSAGTG